MNTEQEGTDDADKPRYNSTAACSSRGYYAPCSVRSRTMQCFFWSSLTGMTARMWRRGARSQRGNPRRNTSIAYRYCCRWVTLGDAESRFE
jgi:hypothetical protein